MTTKRLHIKRKTGPLFGLKLWSVRLDGELPDVFVDKGGDLLKALESRVAVLVRHNSPVFSKLIGTHCVAIEILKGHIKATL